MKNENTTLSAGEPWKKLLPELFQVHDGRRWACHAAKVTERAAKKARVW